MGPGGNESSDSAHIPRICVFDCALLPYSHF